MKRTAIALVVLVTAACTSSAASTTASVSLAEFAIETSTHVIAAGTSDLVIENTGEFGHTLVVTDEAGTVVAATEFIPAGETTTLPVDLESGRYEFTCRIVFETDDGDIVDHYERGMRAAVDVEQ